MDDISTKWVMIIGVCVFVGVPLFHIAGPAAVLIFIGIVLGLNFGITVLKAFVKAVWDEMVKDDIARRERWAAKKAAKANKQ